MKIDISGRHNYLVTDMLKDYVYGKMDKLEKYALKLESAHVVLLQEKQNHTCELVVVGKNLRLTATETTTAMQASFDKAVSNLQNQLRRYHDKIKDHRGEKLIQEDVVEDNEDETYS